MKNPWVGPVPYTYENSAEFHGRDALSELLVKRMLEQRITILTASSGVGKSSLISAGVIPKLIERVTTSKGNTFEGWPAFLLRDWGVATASNADRLLTERLTYALKMQSWTKGVYDGITPPEKNQESSIESEFVSLVRKIVQVSGGCILVFDQFEEVFRSWQDVDTGIYGIIGELYRSFGNAVRVLLSLRSEYLYRLRKLEFLDGGLVGRTVELPPMSVSDAKSAFCKAAENNINIDDSFLNKLLVTMIKRHVRSLSPEDDAGSISEWGEAPCDLIATQAVLHEVTQYCIEHTPSHQHLDADSAKKFLSHLGHETSDPEVVYELLADCAMEHWLNSALKKLGESPVPTELPIHLSEDQFSGAAKNQMAQMAPYLSSGTYKVSAGVQDLKLNVLGPDLEKLCGRSVHSVRDLVKPDSKLDVAQMGFSEDRDQAMADIALSGAAKKYHQENTKPSFVPVVKTLEGIYESMLQCLSERNVLKHISGDRGSTWELVHDQLGPPLIKWADTRRSTWDAAMYALTSRRGDDVILDKASMALATASQLTWLGCWVEPSDTEFILREVCISQSNLRGTIFFNCNFEGGLISECMLDGCMFLNCNFGMGGKPTLFERCEGNGMSFLLTDAPGASSRIDGLIFSDCRLSQVRFSRLNIAGALSFESSCQQDGRNVPHMPLDAFMQQCCFTELHGTGEESVVRFGRCVRSEHCIWDSETEPLIDVERGSMITASGRQFERYGKVNQ